MKNNLLKKTIALSLTAAMAMGTLVGCGGSGDAAATSKTDSTSATSTVTTTSTACSKTSCMNCSNHMCSGRAALAGKEEKEA